MDEQMHTSDPDDLVTSAEAAQIGKVSKITIHRAVKAGKLVPFRTPGGHFRFRRGDIQKLMTTEQASA